jgi:hypothetical protein
LFRVNIVLHHDPVKAINYEDEPTKSFPAVHYDSVPEYGKFFISNARLKLEGPEFFLNPERSMRIDRSAGDS